jgi:hypothetical protein
MVFFSPKFKRDVNSAGKTMYIFHSIYAQNDETHNQIPPLAVSGEILYSERTKPTMTSEDLIIILQELPKECYTQEKSKEVLNQWLSDCKAAFVKTPDLDLLLHKVQHRLDETAPTASISSSEESSDWVLQWVPTKIHLDMPQPTIFWAPCYKSESARIPDEVPVEEDADEISLEDIPQQLSQLDFELQDSGHDSTRLIKNMANTWNNDGLTTLPLAESPSLRLEFDYQAQKEKFRRRVRDARIRAKLARYRAERLAQRYEDRFGEFPEEDDEEAQTEIEKSDME